MSRIVFVTGGARSGKSMFAQELTEQYNDVAYVATSVITDEEMRERVRIHQNSRPQEWKTYETQKNMPRVFSQNTHEAFLVDCITVYIGNAIVEAVDEEAEIIDMDVQFRLENNIMGEIKEIVGTIREKNMNAVFVTNEVGMGLVPEYPMGRMFRDVTGRVNKFLAGLADEAYLLVSGIPIKLK